MREHFASGAVVLELGEADGVARLIIARAARRNALTAEMWHGLAEAAGRIAADPQSLVAVIAGDGGHFSAGADIEELETAFATADSAAEHRRAIAVGVEAVAMLGKPVIAAIGGSCFGGGVALALACDVRLAAPDARFAVTPAKLGLTYREADTRRLVSAIGAAGAKRLLFGAQPIDASAAYRLGLVQDVAESETVLEAAMREARAIAGVSQHSVRAMKQMVDAIAEGAAHGSLSANASLATPDFDEGHRAFLEKRPPNFRKREPAPGLLRR